MKVFGNIIVTKGSDYWEEVSQYLNGAKISYYIIYSGKSKNKDIQKYIDEYVPTPAGTFTLLVNNEGDISIKDFKFKIYDDNLNEIKLSDLPFKVDPRKIKADVQEAIRQLVESELSYDDPATVYHNLTKGQVELEVIKSLGE